MHCVCRRGKGAVCVGEVKALRVCRRGTGFVCVGEVRPLVCRFMHGREQASSFPACAGRE